MPSSGLKTATDGQPKVLVSQQLATAETNIYQVPANSSIKIMMASICNTSGAAVTVGISVVKAAGTAGNANRVVPTTYSLAAGDTLSLRDYLAGHVLGPADFISAIAGTATAITFVMSGVVFS